MVELLSCPFCGGEAILRGHQAPEFWVACNGFGCKASTEGFGSKEKAIAAWNRRAARSTAPEAGKAVVKPLEWEAREKPDLNGNRYWRAQTTFDWGYRIYFEDSRYVIQGGDKDFATLDDAKAAAQADFERRIRSALASVAPSGAEPPQGLSTEPGEAVGWKPTHRHKKRGSTYQVIAEGRLQVDADLDNEKVVVYRGEDGLVWVRPTYEFNDGRFEALPAAPLPEDTHHGR